MITQQKPSTIQTKSSAAKTNGVAQRGRRVSIATLWLQVRNTLRGRFSVLAIVLITLALAQGFFLAHSFQQASNDLDTISNGSIPSVNAAQAIAQYIEDIDAKSADYLATAALTTPRSCQIVGSTINPGLLTVHDCDSRNIDAEMIAADHQVFIAAHNVIYVGERTAIERIIAGFQDYRAQIEIMRHEYALATSTNIHDPHLQMAHQAYSAANNILTTRISSQPATDATRETNLPACIIAGHTVAPNDWVAGSMRDNLECLSYINKSHLDAAYNDTVNFLGTTVILSIVFSIVFSLFVFGATWSIATFTHRVINIGLTLALLVSIVFGIASVTRLAQASGRHGDFGQMVQDDYNSVYYAAMLKKYGTDANADESRWLIALEFGDNAEVAHWQQDWQANTSQVHQLISNAVANRTWIEEDQPLADMQSNWNKYLQIDARIRSTANAGRILDAERLSTGDSNAAFGDFTSAVDQLSQANRQHYDSTLNSTQGTLIVYMFLSIILLPLVGLSAAGGIAQRLKEF